MAMGIPVVATPQAAAGVQAFPGKHLLVANDQSNFATQVIELLANPSFRRQLAEAGQARVLESHCWGTSLRKLDEILDGNMRSVATVNSRQTEGIRNPAVH